MTYTFTPPRKKDTENMPPKVETPHDGWWDLISGFEGPFTSLETLFHALSDQGTKIETVHISADNTVSMRVKWVQGSTATNPRILKFARFSITSDLKDAQGTPQARYVSDVVSLARKKNKIMGRLLTAAWLTHLKAEKKLEELTTA